MLVSAGGQPWERRDDGPPFATFDSREGVDALDFLWNLTRGPWESNGVTRRGASYFDTSLYDSHKRGKFIMAFWTMSDRGMIRNLNQRYGTDYASFQQTTLSRTWPSDSPLAAEWEVFVREVVNPLFLRITRKGRDAYRALLRRRYGTIEEFNRRHGTGCVSFAQAPVTARHEEAGSFGPDWLAFIEEGKICGAVEIDSFDTRYRDFLEEKYKTLSALNAAHGKRYDAFESVPLRLAEYDALIICPAERMWTISVWLYQFQQQVSEPVGFAGLVLSSIPMLLAFLLLALFILCGIVLPVEK